MAEVHVLHLRSYAKQSDLPVAAHVTVFDGRKLSSRELATRFQMILGTYRLRPKALSPKRAARPRAPHHTDPVLSLL